MPLGLKRNTRKRRYRRKQTFRRKGAGLQRYRKRRNYVSMYKSPILEQCYVRLKYVEQFSTAFPTSTITGIYTYQSSLYDPRWSTGGHQPLYFDQYAALYKKYRVFGVKYRYTVMGAPSTGVTIWVKVSSTSTGDTNLETLLERPDRIINRGTDNNGKIVVKGYSSVANGCAVKPAEVRNNPNFASDVTTNPATVMYIIPSLYHMTGANQTMTWTVELTYYAMFFDRVDIAGS